MEDDEAPVRDKGWAWVTCCVSFCAQATTFGVILSFGVIFVELTEEFGSSHAITAWISGVILACLNFTAPVVAWLTTKYSFRSVVLTGTLVCVVGQVASFFVTELYQLFLTVGVVVGVGMGLIYASCIICLQQWFDKRLALANGIFAAGLGVGTFALAPLNEIFIEYYGWRGTMLIIGGVLGQMGWLGMLLKGKKLKTHLKNTINLKDNVASDVEKGSEIAVVDVKQQYSQIDDTTRAISPLTNPELAMRKDLRCKDSHEPISEIHKPDSEKLPRDDKISNNQDESTITNHDSYQCCRFCRGMWNLKLLRNPKFLLYLVVFVPLYVSNVIPFIFLPDRAVELGIDKRSAALLVSIMAACSLVSRLVFGFTGDLVKKGKRLVFGLVILVGGIIQFVSLECTTYWSLAIYAAIQGLSNGSIMALNPVVLRDMVGASSVADAISMQLVVWGVCSLWCGAFIGWLYDVTMSYDAPFIAMGSFISAGGILIIFLDPIASLVCCCFKRKERKYRFESTKKT